MASNEWLVRKLHEQDKKIEALSRGGTGVGHSSIAPGENLTVISDNGEVVLGAGGVEHVDGPTPATPSAPTLKLGFGTIETTWDGTFAEGEDEDGVPLTAPVDFDVVEVHCSTDPEEEEWGEDTMRGQIKTREGGTITVGGFDVDDEVFVCLIALAKTGKRSVPSATASLVIEGLDFSQLFTELDAANATIKNAGEVLVTEQDTLNDKLSDAFGQIGDAVASANGKNVVHYEDRAPSSEGVEEVIATNFFTNPNFVTSDVYAVSGNLAIIDERAVLTATGGSTYVAQITPAAIGAWLSASVDVEWRSAGRARLQVQFRDASGTSIAAAQTVVDRSTLPDGGRVSVKGQIPAGTANVITYFWGYQEGSYTNLTVGQSIGTDKWACRYLETEAEADAAPGEFFDGNTPTEGEGAHAVRYRWTGEANASPSEKYTTTADTGVEGDTWFVGQVGRPNDVVLATNLAKNPKFQNLGEQLGGLGGGQQWGGVIQTGASAQLSVANGWLKVAPGSSNDPAAYIVDTRYFDETKWQGKTFTVSATLRLDAAQTGSVVADARKLNVGYVSGSSVYNYNIGMSSQAPNQPGEYRISVTATIPADAKAWFVRARSGSSVTPTYWTDVQVEEGSTATPFFYGDTPDGQTANEPHYRFREDGTSEKYLPATEGLSSNWNVTEQYRFINGAWENVELSHTVLSSLDLGKLVAGSAAIKEAVVQKLWAEVVVTKMAVAEQFIGENAILTGAVTAPKITASEELWAKIGQFVKIRAEHIEADAIDGMVITGGTYRTSGGNGSWSDAGLFISESDGTSLVRFPTNGEPLSLTASDTNIDRASVGELDVSNGAVRSGGTFSLAAGVTAPASPPELTSGWKLNTTLPRPPEPSMDWTGFAVWNGLYVRGVNVLGSAGDSADRIEVYNTDGTLNKSISIDLNPRAGVAVIGDIVYTIGPDHVAANAGKQWCHGFNLNTGARVSRWEFTRFTAQGQKQFTVGTDGTNLLTAGVTPTPSLYVMKYNPSTGGQIGGAPNPPSTGGDMIDAGWNLTARDLLGVHQAGNELHVMHRYGVRIYTVSGYSITRKPDANSEDGWASWYSPNNNPGGFTFAGGVPVVADSGAVYTGSTSAADYTAEVCYTWYDGTHETTPSPVATVNVAAREQITISLPARAGLQKRLYARAAGDDGKWARSVVPVDVTVSPVPIGIADRTPPSSNSFPASTPAVLKSATGAFEVKGDGSGKWGPLTFNADGTMTGIRKTASGTLDITPTAANTPREVWVTFPEGRFTTTPTVVVSARSSVPGTQVTGVGSGGQTSAGFYAYLTRTNTATTGFNWIAMEEG